MLTARQQEIWQFLVEYSDGHGYPPTVREIGEAVGLASPSTVHAHLANLERAGLLKRDPTKPRALELIGRDVGARARPAPRSAPAAAARPDRRRRAAARRGERGGPHRGARAARPRRRLPARVKGDSMIEPASSTATSSSCAASRTRANGDIVVALVGDDESADEATVKTLLPRERPHPPAARERRARADLRRSRRRSWARSWGCSGACDDRRVALDRTLDQELVALARGVSLACLVCGEFVLHAARRTASSPAPSAVDRRERAADDGRSRSANRRATESRVHAGRVTAGAASAVRSRKVRTPQGRTLGKSQAAKADGKWHRKETAGAILRRRCR